MHATSLHQSAVGGSRSGLRAPAPPNFITRQSLVNLAKGMSWVNRANGVLLTLCGLLGLLHALGHVGVDVLGSVLVSVYVGGFGALLLRYEFAAAADMQRDFGFMYTFLGRTAFLLLVGNLSWTCAPLGFWAALLTNANAILSAYVMVAHPAFIEGRASWTEIGGLGSSSGEEDPTARVFNYEPSDFDPSSVAARQRDAGRL